MIRVPVCVALSLAPGALWAATFDLTQTILNPGPNSFDQFGYSVAVSGSTAVIGAWRDDPGGVGDAGSAYVFDTTTGVLLASLPNPEPGGNDFFGFAVAVSGETVVVGAFSDDPAGVNDAGSAYVYENLTPVPVPPALPLAAAGLGALWVVPRARRG